MHNRIGFKIKAKAEGLAAARISARERDRAGDVVEPRGVVLDSYQKNPVLLLQHGRDPLIGDRPIGRMLDVSVTDDDLIGTWRWSEAPAAQEIRRQWEEGTYNAVSIGFIPRDVAPMPDGRGFHIKTWELLEVSVVSIPMCQSCIALRSAHPQEKCACAHDDGRFIIVADGPSRFELDLRALGEFIGDRLVLRLRRARGLVD